MSLVYGASRLLQECNSQVVVGGSLAWETDLVWRKQSEVGGEEGFMFYVWNLDKNIMDEQSLCAIITVYTFIHYQCIKYYVSRRCNTH